MVNMSSFMDFYQDFLQKKESTDNRRTSAVSLPEDEVIPQEIETIEQTCPVKEVDENVNKMEPVYNRETPVKPMAEISTGLPPVRTILVRKTPQCPSCNIHPSDDVESNEGNQAIVPAFNEITAKELMNECTRIAKYVKNVNSEDEDWEARINQSSWTASQKTLYDKVVKILDSDYLGRLANAGRQNEVIQRRILIDRSAHRMRKVLVGINWDSRLTQWLHCLLLDYLPPSYMAAYLDILQTLKSKVPTLVDKMLFMRPLNSSQELLAPVMKKQWEPVINTKNRVLSQNVVFVAIPSLPFGAIPRRLHRWYQNFGNIAPIYQIALPSTSGQILHQPLEQVAEQIVSLSRVKIQELRQEDSTRSIILIGFGAGSAFALQVAMSEPVSAVVCLGFSYNTINGPRGNPDDRILDIKVPILFVIGQNAQRTSSEEMECLRERLQSESSMVLVGCADDFLRLPKSRRKLENVTQAMVDSMILDEVYEFIKKILTNPPGPRTQAGFSHLSFTKQKVSLANENKGSGQRKRKSEGIVENEVPAKGKFLPQVGRPRTRPLVTSCVVGNKGKVTSTPTNSKQLIIKNEGDEGSQALISTFMEGSLEDVANTSSSGIITTELSDQLQGKTVTNFELVAQSKSNANKAIVSSSGNSTSKIRMIPSNQFVQLKPNSVQSPTKFITIKSGTGAAPIGTFVKSGFTNLSNQKQQIFTINTGTGQNPQFVTTTPGTSVQKFTVVKSPLVPGSTIQLTKNLAEPVSTSNVDLSNIIDMPIVFADNDGNIAETVPTTKKVTSQTSGELTKPTNVTPLIINQKIIREANSGSPIEGQSLKPTGTIVFTKNPTTAANAATFAKQGNKVLYINRNTMKPCSNIIGRTNLSPKFTNLVVTNPKLTGTTTIVPRTSLVLPASSSSASSSAVAGAASTNSVNASNNAVVTNVQTIKAVARPTSGILNVSTKTLPQVQIVNATSPVTGASINIAKPGEKPQIRNIVLKGGLKQITPQLGTQLLNRNVTVRKLVNIVPINRTSAALSGISLPQVTTASEGASSVSSSSSQAQVATIQSSPKILTLTPNTTTTTSTASANPNNNSPAASNINTMDFE